MFSKPYMISINKLIKRYAFINLILGILLIGSFAIDSIMLFTKESVGGFFEIFLNQYNYGIFLKHSLLFQNLLSCLILFAVLCSSFKMIPYIYIALGNRKVLSIFLKKIVFYCSIVFFLTDLIIGLVFGSTGFFFYGFHLGFTEYSVCTNLFWFILFILKLYLFSYMWLQIMSIFLIIFSKKPSIGLFLGMIFPLFDYYVMNEKGLQMTVLLILPKDLLSLSGIINQGYFIVLLIFINYVLFYAIDFIFTLKKDIV